MLQMLPESGRIINIRPCAAGPDNNTQDSTAVNLNNAQMCYIIVNTLEGDAANYTLTIREDGAAVAARNIANNVNIWHNNNIAVNALTTRQANATQLVVAGSTTNKLTIFAINPDRLGDGYTQVILRVDSTTGVQDAGNQIISAIAVIVPGRYKDPR